MSIAVNNGKRQRMAEHVARLRRLGWTDVQLAMLMSVTTGTIGKWGRGASMGLNSQRTRLAALGSPGEERPRLLLLVTQLENEVQRRRKSAGEATERGAHHVAKSALDAIPKIEARIAVLSAVARMAS